VEVIDLEARRYDVVVVGGGAAGLSAALVLGRARRAVMVVDAGEPRNAPAAHMHGFLSRDGMPPFELLARGRREATGYGVDVIEDRVLRIEPGFTAHLASGTAVHARRVLVASGVSDELPDIPGVRERWGRDLLHCPYCHGWEVRDQALGVLGTLPGSVDHAHLVRQWSDDVVFFAHTYDLATTERDGLEARGIRVVDDTVARLAVEHDRITGVEMADGQVIARTAVFVRPGNVPHADGLLAGLGCELDEAGFPKVDRTGNDQRVRRLGRRQRGRSTRPGDHVRRCGLGRSDRDQRRSRSGGRRARRSPCLTGRLPPASSVTYGEPPASLSCPLDRGGFDDAQAEVALDHGNYRSVRSGDRRPDARIVGRGGDLHLQRHRRTRDGGDRGGSVGHGDPRR